MEPESDWRRDADRGPEDPFGSGGGPERGRGVTIDDRAAAAAGSVDGARDDTLRLCPVTDPSLMLTMLFSRLRRLRARGSIMQSSSLDTGFVVWGDSYGVMQGFGGRVSKVQM